MVAIGALGNDANGDSAGHVRLYGWNGRGAWEQRGSDIDGEAAGDQSGFAVSVSSDGRVVAIGANANDDSGDAAGHVRLYAVGGFDVFPEDRNESVDTDQDGIGNNADTDDDGDGVLDRDDAFPLDPTRPVDASNAAIDADNDGVFDSGGQIGADIDGEAAGDFSGRSVSLSSDGQVVAIGAYDNDGNGNNAGHVRLYALDDGNWVQRGSDIDGEAAGDTSGHSVSLSSDGSVVAIGAPYSNGNGEYSGHVRLYAWNGRDWEQRGSDIDGEAVDNYSGISVSLSSDGSVVAIGADYNNDNGEAAGHVRLYAWDGRSWEQRGTDINGEATGDGSGYSVSLSSDGGVVAIGAPGNDGNDVNAGHVRLYSWNDRGDWEQRGSDIDGEAAGDSSGYSVSLSSDGHVVAIGAPGNDANGNSSGHVRLYAWSDGNWLQRGSDIDGEAAGDGSGFSVSLSPEGHVVAIGALGNDANGDSAGHVRLYGWNGRSWEQRGSDIDGEAAGDQSGFAVSLSSDGRVAAIGANANDDSGDAAGHVRLYAVGGFDVFPEDRNESVDTDQDGIGNNADTDDDGDGVLDRDDAFPLDPYTTG